MTSVKTPQELLKELNHPPIGPYARLITHPNSDRPEDAPRILIIGRSGSGKTTLATTLILSDLVDKADAFFIVSPTLSERDPMYSALMQFSTPDFMYKENLTEEIFKHIEKMIEEMLEVEEDARFLILVDDMAAEASTNRGRKGPFADMVIRSKHLHLTIVGLFQQTTTASASLRDNAEFVINFRPTTLDGLDIIRREFSPNIASPHQVENYLKRSELCWADNGFTVLYRQQRAPALVYHNFDRPL
jgi:hypothetical protein